MTRFFPLVLAGAASLGLVAVLAADDHPLPPGWSWEQLMHSAAARQRGLSNDAPPEARQNLARLVTTVLDPLQRALAKPVVVTSGYRSPVVNSALGREPTSLHVTGEAVDFFVRGASPEEVAAAVLRLRLPFHELIWYAPGRGNHVHVALRAAGDQARRVRYAPERGGLVAALPSEVRHG